MNYQDFLNIFLGKVQFTPNDASGSSTQLINTLDPNDIEYVATCHLPISLLRELVGNDLGVAFSVQGQNDFPRRTTSSATTTRPSYFNVHDACQAASIDFSEVKTELSGKFRADPGADDFVASGKVIRFSKLENMTSNDYVVLPSIIAKACGRQLDTSDRRGDESLLRMMITNDSFTNLVNLIVSDGFLKNNPSSTNLTKKIKSNQTLDTITSFPFSDLDSYASNTIENRPSTHEIIRAIIESFPPSPLNVNDRNITSRFYSIEGVQGDAANDVSILKPTFPDVNVDMKPINIQVVVETGLTVDLGRGNSVSTTPSPESSVNFVDSSPIGNRVLILLNMVFDQGLINVDTGEVDDLVDGLTDDQINGTTEATDQSSSITGTFSDSNDINDAISGVNSSLGGDADTVFVSPGSVKFTIIPKVGKYISSASVASAVASALGATTGSITTRSVTREDIRSSGKLDKLIKTAYSLPDSERVRVLATAGVTESNDSGGEVSNDSGGEVSNDSGGQGSNDSGGEVSNDSGGEVSNDSGDGGATVTIETDFTVTPNDFGFIMNDYLNPSLRIKNPGTTTFNLSALSSNDASNFNFRHYSGGSYTDYGTYDSTTQVLTVTIPDGFSTGSILRWGPYINNGINSSSSPGIYGFTYCKAQGSTSYIDTSHDYTYTTGDVKVVKVFEATLARTVLEYEGVYYDTPNMTVGARTYFDITALSDPDSFNVVDIFDKWTFFRAVINDKYLVIARDADHSNLYYPSKDFNKGTIDIDKSEKSPTIDAGSTVLSSFTAWYQVGQDIDGEVAEDYSGCSVASSSDGSIVAIGAKLNDGNGNKSGHTRVYSYNQGTSSWVQLGSDIDGENSGDMSGVSVALSSDGTRLAIGATLNSGNGYRSGHVRVYEYSSGWVQMGSDIDGEAVQDQSGVSVALSSDGTRVVIGANRNDGNGSDSGHVRVYDYDQGSWSQVGGDVDGGASEDWFGINVAISNDGSVIGVGAYKSDPNGTESGQASVYSYNQGTSSWVQLGSHIEGEAASDQFGRGLALSSDGTRVAIGGTGNDGNGSNSGHVRVYDYNQGTSSWTQVGSDIDGETSGDAFGNGLAISDDGTTIAVGAIKSTGNRGHVRVFKYESGSWVSQGAGIIGEAKDDRSGIAVSMSSDGSRVFIGSETNTNSNGTKSGHVRVYRPVDYD